MNNIDIHINNYEEFALDYLENNLSPTAKSSFERFLKIHPEIAEELNGLLDYKVVADTMVFDEKEKLFKKSPGLFNHQLVIVVAVLACLLAGGFALYFQTIKTATSSVSAPQPVEVPSETLTTDAMVKKQIFKEAKKDEAGKHVKSSLEQPQVATPLEGQPLSGQSAVESFDEEALSKKQNKLNDKSNNNYRKSQNKPSDTPLSTDKTMSTRDSATKRNQSNSTPIENPFLPSDNKKANTSGEKPIAHVDNNKTIQPGDVSEAINGTTNNAGQELELRTNDMLVNKIESPAIAQVDPKYLETKDLAARIPDITIDIEPLSDNDDIIAIAEAPQKKKKFSFRNFIPEQFAGITKEEIKRSLIPENLTSR